MLLIIIQVPRYDTTQNVNRLGNPRHWYTGTTKHVMYLVRAAVNCPRTGSQHRTAALITVGVRCTMLPNNAALFRDNAFLVWGFVVGTSPMLGLYGCQTYDTTHLLDLIR